MNISDGHNCENCKRNRGHRCPIHGTMLDHPRNSGWTCRDFVPREINRNGDRSETSKRKTSK